MRKYILLTALFPLVIWINIAFAQDCTTLIEDALDRLAQSCSATSRNQACYGHDQLSATGYSSDITFGAVGDLEDIIDLESISAMPASEDSQIWGIALLKVQSNLPDTIPGQNATILVLGNTEVTNLVDKSMRIIATTNASARVRATPIDGQVTATLPSGTVVTAFGRNEAGDWIRIQSSAGAYGWTADFLLDANTQFSELPVVESTAELPPSPMQAFILKSGITQADCSDVPEGLVIHTPQGVGNIQFTVNGTLIDIASTIHLQTVPTDSENILQVQTLEGRAIVSNEFGLAVAGAGSQVQVPLDSSGSLPSGAPETPEPISQEDLDNLQPVLQFNDFVTLIDDDIPPTIIEEALTEEEVVMLNDVPEDLATLNGMWRIEHIQEALTGDSGCVAPPIANFTEVRRYTLSEDGQSLSHSYDSGGFSYDYALTGGSTYRHQNGSTALGAGGLLVEITFISPVTLVGHYEYAWGDYASNGDAIWCRVESRVLGTRVGS